MKVTLTMEDSSLVTENACPKQRVSDERDAPVRIVLPFKDQKSANALRHQLSDLNRKIDADVYPVYTSIQIKGKIKPKEHKPPIVNQRNVVYYFKCDCAMKTMLASGVDTYINVWRNTSDQHSAIT